ncbi:MAG: Cytoplasmic axial filament protein CafA and Ribonuclease G, partial [uncultured Thermomicrobiales bacterium]
ARAGAGIPFHPTHGHRTMGAVGERRGRGADRSARYREAADGDRTGAGPRPLGRATPPPPLRRGRGRVAGNPRRPGAEPRPRPRQRRHHPHRPAARRRLWRRPDRLRRARSDRRRGAGRPERCVARPARSPLRPGGGDGGRRPPPLRPRRRGSGPDGGRLGRRRHTPPGLDRPVAAKPSSFTFFRVLRPGGRIPFL